MASGAVGLCEVASGAVGLCEVAPGAVKEREVVSGAVGLHEVASGAVDQREVASGAVKEHRVVKHLPTGGMSLLEASRIFRPTPRKSFWSNVVQSYFVRCQDLGIRDLTPVSHKCTVSGLESIRVIPSRCVLRTVKSKQRGPKGYT